MNAPEPEFRDDVIDPARAAALWAALDLPGMPPSRGEPLPPFFHHLYFWDMQSPARLGRDGHPKVGQGVIPDMGLPRRMWAGGRLQFQAPLRTGIPARRETRLLKADRKDGRSGPLAFVSLHHTVRQDGVLCLTEAQDLVYRAEPDPAAPTPEPPRAPDAARNERQVHFDTTLLFRYSALTFNGHRIHYDAAYARDVEGYGGLVVHGPLLAQQLMLMATETLGPLSAFEFRLTAPLICGEAAVLCEAGHDFWVRGPDGKQCIRAKASPRHPASADVVT